MRVVKLAMISVREGWHYSRYPSITATIADHGHVRSQVCRGGQTALPALLPFPSPVKGDPWLGDENF